MILKREKSGVWVNEAGEQVLKWREHGIFDIPENAVKVEIIALAKTSRKTRGLHIIARHGKLHIVDLLTYPTSNALYKFIYEENQKGNYYFDRVILK